MRLPTFSLLLRLPTSSTAAFVLGLLLMGSGCARRQFFQPDARPLGAAGQPLPAAADSAHSLTAGRQYAERGRLYQALVGRHHRPSWGAPISLPVFRLDKALPAGPLTPGKLGGGFNSTSLSLKGPQGQQYVLRTLDKDPSRVMPPWLQRTFLATALRDNISATNPYGALVVPPLAAALGVAHTTPRVFYVRADDPRFLPDSLRRLRGQLALLEQKFDGPGVDVPALGKVDVVGSTEAFKQVFASPAARFDQAALLTARLFDAWIGDWDRHTGQWNWAVPAASGPGSQPQPVVYRPIPKDRDMVFYRLDDGVLGWVLGRVIRPSWNTFAPRFTSVKGLMHNARYLDTRALNALSRPQFEAAARSMQQRLPDTLLTRALRRMPGPVQAIEGARALSTLQARRAALPRFATDFYRRLARRPVVGGTAQAERFEILRTPDSTVVTITTLPATGSPTVSYRRAFFPQETVSIQLEALGGNDVFVVQQAPGPARTSRPRLRLYGGAGEDELRGATSSSLRFSQESAAAKKAYDRISED